jgi:hypothetical protein
MPLVSVLGADAAASLSGPAGAATAASSLGTLSMATLGSLLKILGPDNVIISPSESSVVQNGRDVRNGSYALLQAMSQLMAHNHLRYIIDIIKASFSVESSYPQSPEAIVSSVLTLCTTIASKSKEGAECLLECGIVEKLGYIPKYIPNSMLHASASDSLEQLKSLLSSSLQLFRSLVANLPDNLTVVNGCAQFIEKNHMLVMMVLSMRSGSLKDFILLESISALLSLLSASNDFSQWKIDDIGLPGKSSSSSSLSRSLGRNKTESTPITSALFEGKFSQSPDSLTGEICKLIDIIGICLLYIDIDIDYVENQR